MSGYTLIRSFLASKVHEKQSRKTILNLQEKKFRNILKFAFKHSEFYHNLYNSNGITEDNLDTIRIDELPIVDKNIIMNNFDDVITTNHITKQDIMNFLEKSKDPNELFKNKYHVVHTSGSSGKIGVFVYSKKDWDSFFPYITRVFDFRFGRSKSVFFGAADGHYAGASFAAWTGKSLIRLFCVPLILDISKPLDNHIKKLNDFRPDILGGYFTGLKILAEQQEKGLLHLNPRNIVNCGEGIIPKDKEFIEKVFNAPMTNLYGTAECVVMGAGKNAYGGIYIMDDLCLVEIREDHALLTNLFNKTQPLIRYKINDFFVLKSDIHKKMPFTLVGSIVGRSESMIWFENNEKKMDFIHPIVIAEFYVKGLDKLQLVIKDKKSFEFLAVITDNNKEKVIKKIKEKFDKLLKEKNFTDVVYSIKVVKSLKVDKKTGKFKLIVYKDK
jgi:phenylacetate-CoA ligase